MRRNTITIAALALVLCLVTGPLVFRDARQVCALKNPSPAEQTVMAFAESRNLSISDYPASLIQLLERNPETERFVLDYPLEHDKEHDVDLSDVDLSQGVPLFLQWDQRWGYLRYGSDVAGLTACGPVCLAMAGYYVTGDPAFSPEKMIAYSLENGYYSWGNGTEWALISQGGVKLGLDVTEIPLDEGRILANLEVGNPIICVVGPGDFTTEGHFIVLTGCENGQIRVNDPNSVENSQKLWDYAQLEGQILNLWVIRAGS